MSTERAPEIAVPVGVEVIIVGAGLAGLSCALVLENNGVEYAVLEKASSLGGKVSTDRIDGFVLDRGFQVYLDQYPMGRRLLDYTKLELRPFYKGLYIDTPSGSTTLVSHPMSTYLGVKDFRRVISIQDVIPSIKALIAQIRYPETATAEILKRLPSSSVLRRSILEPLLKGVLLDQELETPISFAKSIVDWLARGGASLPALGMDMIPKHLASQLGRPVNLDTEVVAVSSKGVELADGKRIASRCTVIATEASATSQLLPGTLPKIPYRSIGYTYFSAHERPLGHAAVYVPSLHKGPILTVSVLSDVSIYYAPQGQHLISVSHRAGASLAEIRSQLKQIFKGEASSWEDIASGVIEEALPVTYGKRLKTPIDGHVGENIILAGDFLKTPSINGALTSGVDAARTVLAIVKGGGSTTEPRVK